MAELRPTDLALLLQLADRVARLERSDRRQTWDVRDGAGTLRTRMGRQDDGAFDFRRFDSAGTQVVAVQPGDIKPSAAAAAQPGWLLCDGTVYAITAYPLLAAAISNAYGGNGTTTFAVPDLRGRTLVAAGAGAGLTARSAGQTGGEETHLLSTAELPSHNHAVTDPGHNHVMNNQATNPWIQVTDGTTIFTGSGASPTWYNNNLSVLLAATTGISIQNTGGGGAHNNMPPFVVVNFYIFTGGA